MNDCIFCKIAKGEIPCAKIWEDDKHIAFLDKFPNVRGMALVIPKKHFDSYAFDMEDNELCNLIKASKKVARLLDKKLNVKRTAMVMEGLGVNHVHIKLYPLYGLQDNFKEIWAKDRKYFECYEGYVSTQQGPEKSIEELNKLASEIKR